MILAGLGLFPSVTFAQPVPIAQLPMFETITLKPGFSPQPTVIRGVSGGSTQASQVVQQSSTVNGPCVGYIDQQPEHTIILKQSFSGLSLRVRSKGDTTLAIQGPGGIWCNDDYEGRKSPGISGEWKAGTYKLWVGSYKEAVYYPYRIEIEETRLSN